MTNDTQLETGAAAPGFEMPTNGGETVSLAGLKGRKVVLYFYPRDDTPGCTTEAIEFTAAAGAFDAAGATVIGVSKDTVAKHDKFAAKHDLGVILASDAETAVCEDYGVWVEKKNYGKTYMGIERSTFLIGVDGKIARVWRKVRVKGHVDEVLEATKAL